MRRLLTLAVGSGVLAVAAAGCGTSSDDTPPGPALEMSCDNPAFGEIEDTEVQLSDPGAPTKALFRVTASLQQPGVVDVEAGTYSVLNTNRGGIEVEVCPDVTLSDVEPAQPEMGTPVSP